MNAEKIIKDASLSVLEFGIAISKLNKTRPMKNVIEQIRKIKGVVTVEKAGENMAVVVFGCKHDAIEFDGRYFFPFGKSSAEINPSIFDEIEPMSEETAKSLLNIFKPKEPWQGRQYVKCTTEKEFEFVKKQNGLTSHYDPFDTWLKYPCVCVNGTDVFSSGAFPERELRVIDFDKYLLFFGLRDKWKEANKPKSLTTEELVGGRIYVDENNGRIIRFNKCNTNGTIRLHSQLYDTLESKGNFGAFISGYNASGSIFHQATHSESKTLIRSEVEHGYFHELKDAK